MPMVEMAEERCLVEDLDNFVKGLRFMCAGKTKLSINHYVYFPFQNYHSICHVYDLDVQNLASILFGFFWFNLTLSQFHSADVTQLLYPSEIPKSVLLVSFAFHLLSLTCAIKNDKKICDDFAHSPIPPFTCSCHLEPPNFSI